MNEWVNECGAELSKYSKKQGTNSSWQCGNLTLLCKGTYQLVLFFICKWQHKIQYAAIFENLSERDVISDSPCEELASLSKP